jgi:feruloyl esterase
MLIPMISMRIVLAISAVSVASTAWGQQNCESLASLKLPSITVTSAVSVAAGPFTLPGGRGNNTTQTPAFCRVAATIEKEVRIELWMPKAWNKSWWRWATAGSPARSAMRLW